MMRACAAALVALIVASCAPVYGDAYGASVTAGERAMNAGRFDEAARAFDDAAGKARRVKDRDEARFLEARAFEKIERWTDVEATYKRLVADSPNGPRSIRAEFELADLAIDRGDAQKGAALLLEAMRHHPEHGSARPALAKLLRRAEDAGGDDAALAWLRSIAQSFTTTDLDQPIAYEIARTLERLGKTVEARDAYLATARAHPYPFGGLTDDALEHAAEIDVELKRPEQAIEDLRQLLSPREASTTVGSYERPLFSRAQLRIAQIYRDELKDHASARREFYKLYTDFPTSILRDDALWQDARIAREDGDQSGACSLLVTLGSTFPESRYVACEALLCATLTPPRPAHDRPARECSEYIQRDLAAPELRDASTGSSRQP